MMLTPTSLTPVNILRVGNRLGEGILWDSRLKVLWWTDIPECRLYRFDWTKNHLSCFTIPERLASFAIVRDSEELLGAFATGLGLFSPPSQSIAWLARPFSAESGVRFNDGRVDRRGRFWSATMLESPDPHLGGGLYSLDWSLGFRKHVNEIQIGNGLCMSRDGKMLYFADSAKRTIHTCELQTHSGELGVPRLFAHTPEGSYPDGATIDADGYMWSAHWGAGAVVRYSPEGEIDWILTLPVSQPTCVCFGGPNLDLLCVSTAREGLSAKALGIQPEAGNVLIYQTGHRGLPENEYQP